ncbi:MAG: hypothetical protein KC435_11925 [Thermomicrobiales bacterium]|nr:hypothetical protein [Thermomicrobiales bacterium]
MFRRRGCLFGCGSILLICVALGLVGWFVGVPRVVDTLQESVGDTISTYVAEEISSGYSRAQLQQGADVPFYFAAINNDLSGAEAGNDGFEELAIRGRGNEIVMEATFTSGSYEIAFVPSITSDGRLELTPTTDGNWFEDKVMDVLGGGFEQSINTWLEENGLVLTDIRVGEDAVILSVTGE